MATDLRREEEPTRFGSPLDVDLPNLQTFENRNMFECRILLCPESEGGFSAHALRLPGVVSQGESVDEALSNIADAFRGAVVVYRENDQAIPWEEVALDRPAGSLERWILVDV